MALIFKKKIEADSKSLKGLHPRQSAYQKVDAPSLRGQSLRKVFTSLEHLRGTLGFRMLYRKREDFHLNRNAQLVQDIVAVVGLRQESEISLDSLVEDLSRSLNYPVDLCQVHQSIQYLRRGGLVTVDWNARVIRRTGYIKEYIAKQVVGSEMWLFVLDDWLSISIVLQNKYGKINPDFQDFLIKAR